MPSGAQQMLRYVLVAAALLPAVAASGAESGLTFATCSEDDPLQHFDASDLTGEGRITDVTGRCVTVKGCNVAMPYGSPPVPSYGSLVLDVCGSDTCGGKASRFKGESTATEKATLFRSDLSTDAKCYAINAVGGATGGVPADDVVVVWGMIGACPDSGKSSSGAPNNSEFLYDESKSQLKVVQSDRVASYCPQTDNCCLTALPCKPPACVAPSGWAWPFIICFCLCCAGYVGGGLAHASRADGSTITGLSDHPHHALWLNGAGLVSDGVSFTKARIREYRDGRGAGYEKVVEGVEEEGGEKKGKRKKKRRGSEAAGDEDGGAE